MPLLLVLRRVDFFDGFDAVVFLLGEGAEREGEQGRISGLRGSGQGRRVAFKELTLADAAVGTL